MFDLTTSTVKALAYLGQKYLHPWFLFLLLNDGLSSFSLHHLVCPPFSRQSDRLKPSSNAYLSLLKALWTLTHFEGKKKNQTSQHDLSQSEPILTWPLHLSTLWHCHQCYLKLPYSALPGTPLPQVPPTHHYSHTMNAYWLFQYLTQILPPLGSLPKLPRELTAVFLGSPGTLHIYLIWHMDSYSLFTSFVWCQIVSHLI